MHPCTLQGCAPPHTKILILNDSVFCPSRSIIRHKIVPKGHRFFLLCAKRNSRSRAAGDLTNRKATTARSVVRAWASVCKAGCSRFGCARLFHTSRRSRVSTPVHTERRAQSLELANHALSRAYPPLPSVAPPRAARGLRMGRLRRLLRFMPVSLVAFGHPRRRQRRRCPGQPACGAGSARDGVAVHPAW